MDHKKEKLCSIIHVCRECIDKQINEANLLPPHSTFLNKTLLYPQTHCLDKKVSEYYIRGMCRDCDRTQRVLCLDKALKISPNFREALFWSGILDFRDVKENISKLNRALSLTEHNTCKGLVIQSQIFVIQRNLEKAVELLNHAFDLADNDGERGEVAYFRAFSNWWVDRDTEALADFKIAISFHYNIKSCYTQMAEIYSHMGKPRAEIEELFQKSLLPSARHTELLKYGAYLKRVGDFERAILMLTSAKERNPLSPDSYEELAFGVKREENCLAAIQLDTEHRLVHCRRILAAIYADSNRFGEALRQLTEGINAKEKHEWYCFRGQLLIARNLRRDYKQGIKDLRKAVRLNPLSVDAQYWLGKSLERDPSATAEVIQRYSNVLYLSPKYSRLPDSVREHIQSLDFSFKLYDGELEGLFNYFLYGSVHVSVSVINKSLNLLACLGDSNMLYILFRDYYRQFENWVVSSSSNESLLEIAKHSLRCIWEQKLDISQCEPMMMNIPSSGSKWANLHLNQSVLDKSIVLSEFNAQCLDKVDKNLFKLAVAYLYRKDIIVSKEIVQRLLQLVNQDTAGVCPHKNKSENKYKQLNKFLYHFVTKDNLHFSKTEKIATSWTDELTHSNEEESSADAPSPINRNAKSFLPRGSLNFLEKELYYEKENVESKENILLPLSHIPKILSKLVNNPLYSNIKFLFTRPTRNEDINSELSPRIEYDVIYGHKEIIEASSRYFKNMFHSGLKESRQAGIVISDIPRDIFLEVLYHLYGGDVRFTPNNCIPILEVADMICLESLKMVTELYIGNNIDLDDISEVANLYSAKRLQSLCRIKYLVNFESGEDSNNEDSFFTENDVDSLYTY